MDKDTVNKLLSTITALLVKAHLHGKEYKGQPVRRPIDLPDVPDIIDLPDAPSNRPEVSNKRKQNNLPLTESKAKLPKQEKQIYPPFKIKGPVEKDLKTEKTVDEHLHAKCKAEFDNSFISKIKGNDKEEYAYVSHDNEYCYGTVTKYKRESEEKPFVETKIDNVKCPIEPVYEKGTNKSKYTIDECEFE